MRLPLRVKTALAAVFMALFALAAADIHAQDFPSSRGYSFMARLREAEGQWARGLELHILCS